MTEPLMLPCPEHGSVEWQGDVFCKNCSMFFLCSGVEETDQFTDKGEKKTKYVYPDAPEKGACTCGKRLFGGTDFTARPMCHECAINVMSRKAQQEGRIFIHWKRECPHGGVRYPDNFDDYADPLGDHSFELWTARNGDEWNWEVSFPKGHCGGYEKTQLEARAMAEKIYKVVMPEKT